MCWLNSWGLRLAMIEISKFQLDFLDSVHMISALVSIAYRKTGNKFFVSWCGSKGYLSHLEISAEGVQAEDTNRVWAHELFTKKGSFRKRILIVSYCHESGVHLKVK